MATGDDDNPADATDSAAQAQDDGNQIERHPEVSNLVLVAPSLADDQTFNAVVRPSLEPIACWRLDDHRFDFDSSFILPGAQGDLHRLAAMHDDYDDSPMSLFGHADPVGSETYNKTLSGNRAQATFALLTRNLDMWETLFHDHSWGLRSTQTILLFLEQEDLKKPDATDEQRAQAGSFAADGKDTAAWQAAVRRFQTKTPGLAVDGDAGKNTRRELYDAYMDIICAHPDGTPFQVKPTQFLGKGADPKGKADYQGCSEFNPVLLMSQTEEKAFKDSKNDEGRNSVNAPNRRVVMYFFAPNLVIDPAVWPCPRASEGTAGCTKRFWSDHDERTKPDPDERRQYEKTRDTFACRFYDRFAFRSPCEAGFKEWIVQLIRPGAGSPLAREAVAGASFQAVVGGRAARGTTDAKGTLRIRARQNIEDVKVTLNVPIEPPKDDDDDGKAASTTGGSTKESATAQPKFVTTVLTLAGGRLKELDEATETAETPASEGPAAPDKDLAVVQRLLNLGYGPIDPKALANPQVLAAALLAFQKDHKQSHGLDESGNQDDATVAALKDVYGS